MGQGGSLSHSWSTDPRVILNPYVIILKKKNILKALGSKKILKYCSFAQTRHWVPNHGSITLKHPFRKLSEFNPNTLRWSKLNLLYTFFWVIHRRLKFTCQRFGTLCLFHLHRRVGMKYLLAYEDGIDRVFRNVGIYTSDEGESPRRKHTTFRTRRKFEINKSYLFINLQL
jgi:hypothetical protein